MKILVVFTGGTIGCSDKGGVLTPESENSYKLIEMYRRLDGSAEFVCVQPYTILSENLSGGNLSALYNCIKPQLNNGFDGVIVAHGTDTLQYTSAFLSYAFGLRDIPIVLVSANYPLDDKRSNGLQNFAAAVDFIKARSGGGVFAAYTNGNESPKIHRGTRLLPHLPYDDKIFSVFDGFYGEIIDGEFVKNKNYTEQSDKITLDGSALSDTSNVIKLSAHPSMSYPALTKSTKAVLIEGYHSGTLATSDDALKEFCRKANALEIPVFLTGACRGFYYESKLEFNRLNIKVLPAASPASMYVKLWMLGKDRLNDVFLPCGGDFAEFES